MSQSAMAWEDDAETTRGSSLLTVVARRASMRMRMRMREPRRESFRSVPMELAVGMLVTGAHPERPKRPRRRPQAPPQASEAVG